MSPQTLRNPSFAQSLVCFSVIVALIVGGLFELGISLHALTFLCLLWAGINAFSLGYKYLQIRELMARALTRAMPAIYIFIFIGMVIASFMQSGTISTLIIPWTTAGAFYSATLGVDVLDYAPYAFFNYLNGVIAVTMAVLGVGLLKGKTAKR